jgi:hypothetical protein
MGIRSAISSCSGIEIRLGVVVAAGWALLLLLGDCVTSPSPNPTRRHGSGTGASSRPTVTVSARKSRGWHEADAFPYSPNWLERHRAEYTTSSSRRTRTDGRRPGQPGSFAVGRNGEYPHQTPARSEQIPLSYSGSAVERRLRPTPTIRRWTRRRENFLIKPRFHSIILGRAEPRSVCCPGLSRLVRRHQETFGILLGQRSDFCHI